MKKLILALLFLAAAFFVYMNMTAQEEEDYMTDSGEVEEVSDDEIMTDSGEIEEVSEEGDYMTDSGEVREESEY